MLTEKFLAEIEEHKKLLFNSMIEVAEESGIEITDEYKKMVEKYIDNAINKKIIATIDKENFKDDPIGLLAKVHP